ncbi:MAG: hypothetical protein NC038_07740 [Paludibacter sp.]|nr:hypothetical protein [Bacteroidales bacterium]MCM1069944.1 hypothetical protein [Prevotella sp.]MCM1354652.1 hypothetical protein [Bacteroides sp.]MCM1443634.1 hypothetical protein [Muribaculum sp.]MCM1482509.1 hypothetical protein [Paludibacter sp.]
MKRLYLLCLACCFSAFLMAQWQEQSTTLKCGVGYGYNYTWEHYAWIDAMAFMPINAHFEMDVAAQANLANVYTIGVTMRPKFPVKVGEVFLETRLLYKAVERNRLHDFNGGFSVGYRMDYLSLQIGIAGRIMEEMQADWHSENAPLFEPLMLYAVEAYVRPQVSRWNISARIANFDTWQTERFFQPLFMLNGRLNLTDKLRLLIGVECKPTGMFHLNASFYEAQASLGIVYAFK